MLYVKHVTKSGKEKFFPVLDNNVYVFCDRCEQMVLIPDPAGYDHISRRFLYDFSTE